LRRTSRFVSRISGLGALAEKLREDVTIASQKFHDRACWLPEPTWRDRSDDGFK
jgi:hypothetical protein